MFVDVLYLPNSCAWAESTWTAISVFDRHGQQNLMFCCACEPSYEIWSQHKHRFWAFNFTYNSLRCRDLKIRRFWGWQTTTGDNRRQMNKPIALPLAHAHGVKMRYEIMVHATTVKHPRTIVAFTYFWSFHQMCLARNYPAAEVL